MENEEKPLRKARKAAGMTMTQLAILSGCSVTKLSLIERGVRCTQRTCDRLAGALGVNVLDLFPDYAGRRKE